MNPTYAQGVDVVMLLHDFENFELLPGYTVTAEFRKSLSDVTPLAKIGTDPAGITATVDTVTQTIAVRIPAAVNLKWHSNSPSFWVHTTIIVVAADGTHLIPIPVSAEWQTSYTRSLV
jgi:hypothetical protein